MSHSKQRAEKICLNCSADVQGRYCSTCGQENLEPQESVWQLVTHFFNDITHFDGKFFSTLKYLITKPGFLTKEYMAGRRAAYLNPVRLYIFTSAIFFLLYFSFFAGNHETTAAYNEHPTAKTTGSQDTNANTESEDSTELEKYSQAGRNLEFSGDILQDTRYRDRAQYDSLCQSGAVKDGIVSKWWTHRKLALKRKYGRDEARLNEDFRQSYLHSLPQLFFLSLPLFALFLKLLYIRRKRFYYVSHVIFSIHVYVFAYIAMFLTFLFGDLSNVKYFGWLFWLNIVLVLCVLFYAYKAMRKLYEQRRLKTILKFFLLVIWLFFILGILMTAMYFFSIYKL